jgi:hypothetical protein
LLRYKASDSRQIDSRIHSLKSKLADEEHKNATMTLAAEQLAKDIAAKNATLYLLQDQNNEMKLSISGNVLKMRMLDDEIQVFMFGCILSLVAEVLCLQALKHDIMEARLAHDVEIASLRAQSKREISALEVKLEQNTLQ